MDKRRAKKINGMWTKRKNVTYVCIMYHVLNESQQKPKTDETAEYPQEKDRMKQAASKSKSGKGRKGIRRRAGSQKSSAGGCSTETE